MTTRVNGVQETSAEVVDTLKPDAGASIDQRPIEAESYAEERESAARPNAIQSIERIETAHDIVRRADMAAMPIRRASPAGAWVYDVFEDNFRSHHHTNADRRRGPYEHYRLVYRYGYDLGVDPRYRSAEWPTVEQEARPRWEERNPSTWEQFKDTIRYAWDTTRSWH